MGSWIDVAVGHDEAGQLQSRACGGAPLSYPHFLQALGSSFQDCGIPGTYFTGGLGFKA